MKIGFFCESPADRAALSIFAQALLGTPPEPINMDLEAHGVSSVLTALDGVYRGVHYNSDAEGLVVVVDSDDTELHTSSHDEGSGEPRCRFCQIRKIIERAQSQLKPVVGKPPLKVAVGLAVPAIEAWLLVGKEREVGEARWSTGQRPFDRRQLKQKVYGDHRASLVCKVERSEQEARRIVGNLRPLEDAFPVGFGLMAQEIRSWATSK